MQILYIYNNVMIFSIFTSRWKKKCNLYNRLFKINEKKPSIVDFFPPVVPKLQGHRFAFDIGGDITSHYPPHPCAQQPNNFCIFDRPLTTVSCHLKSLFIAYGSQHIHNSYTAQWYDLSDVSEITKTYTYI